MDAALPPDRAPSRSSRRRKVLVVDDERPILEAITYNLRKAGYEPLTATDAEQCLTLVHEESPDVIILDVMLPSASGFDVCRQLRAYSRVPIIMLTARVEETDRVVGLEAGADDYVTKPFGMQELMARVKAALRRNETPLPAPPLRLGSIVIDPQRHTVTVSGRPVTTTRKEFDLLHFLAASPGQVFSRQALLDRVWGEDSYVEDRTVDVHIRWLRQKIEADPARPHWLQTVRGIGYKFSDDF